MTKAMKQVAGSRLGDAELVLLASGAKRDDRLIAIPDAMKPVTRQRAAGNLIKRGLAEERSAGVDDPIWREGEGGRFSLIATQTGLAAIGIEEETPTAVTEEGRPVDASHPREGTKGALVVSLLTRGSGASIDELIEVTGWLPHTTRAALTGLRKRGYAIERGQGEGGSSVYRIPVIESATTRKRSRAAAKAA